MSLLRRILLLCMSCLPQVLQAQTADLSATSDLFAMFPPTLTAKEAQEKWETIYKSKCSSINDAQTICKTFSKTSPMSEITLSLNPKERAIDMLSVRLLDGPIAKMSPNEILKKLPLEKETPTKDEEENGVTQYQAKTLMGWYKLPLSKDKKVQSISRVHDPTDLGFAPKYAIRCSDVETKKKVANLHIESKCQGNSTIDLVIQFEDDRAPANVDFQYQSSKIIETMEAVAPNTQHPEVWLKALSVFKEMVGDNTLKPEWFNTEFPNYQLFPFGSFYFKTRQDGKKQIVEASWMEP